MPCPELTVHEPHLHVHLYVQARPLCPALPLFASGPGSTCLPSLRHGAWLSGRATCSEAAPAPSVERDTTLGSIISAVSARIWLLVASLRDDCRNWDRHGWIVFSIDIIVCSGIERISQTVSSANV